MDPRAGRRSAALWLAACLVLVLLVAAPGSVEAKKKKKNKARQRRLGNREPAAAPSGGGSGVVGGGGSGGSVDGGGGGGGARESETMPRTRDDALVWHSEGTQESSWSWRGARRKLTRTWEDLSAGANSFGEKVHMPSQREREMAWYYTKLVGSRMKAGWVGIDWNKLAEEIPEVKGFLRTYAEFKNATGFAAGWRGVIVVPAMFMWGVAKFLAGLAMSPVSTMYSAGRWVCSSWVSTAGALLLGAVLYQSTTVKLTVTPAGMPPLPPGAQEVYHRRRPQRGHFTADNMPKNLRGRQVNAKDCWARVNVSSGRLVYRALGDPGPDNVREKVLSYMTGGAIIPPQMPFEISPADGKAFRFRMVYYRVPPPAAAVDAASSSPSEEKAYTRKITFGSRRSEAGGTRS